MLCYKYTCTKYAIGLDNITENYPFVQVIDYHRTFIAQVVVTVELYVTLGSRQELPVMRKTQTKTPAEDTRNHSSK